MPLPATGQATLQTQLPCWAASCSAATPSLTVQYCAGGIFALCVLHCWAERVPGVLPCIPDLQDNPCFTHLWVIQSTSGYECHLLQKHGSPWAPGLQVVVDLSKTGLSWQGHTFRAHCQQAGHVCMDTRRCRQTFRSLSGQTCSARQSLTSMTSYMVLDVCPPMRYRHCPMLAVLWQTRGLGIGAMDRHVSWWGGSAARGQGERRPGQGFNESTNSTARGGGVGGGGGGEVVLQQHDIRCTGCHQVCLRRGLQMHC